MKTVRPLIATLAALGLASCGPKTVVEGTLQDKGGADIVVKLLDINKYQVLDTVKTDVKGAYRYAADIEKGQPEFIYLFYGDRKIASLLVEQGDRIRVVSDTLGNATVEGSEASRELQELEGDYAQFLSDMYRTSLRSDAEASQDLSRRYVEYYRRCVTYVMTHSKSLTAVPVLFQQVDEGFPVFNQATDALLFRNVCDSLRTVYPESRYVKALDREAERRQNAMEIGMKLRSAGEVGFLDIELPSPDGMMRKLSEVEGKVVMLYFWASTGAQKMFNLDALLPLYDDFHGRGLEIFAVSFDVDKTVWATAVRNQRLPWVNVCDTRGIASPYVNLYRVAELPMVYFIVDGAIDGNARVTDIASIRKYLEGKL